MSCPSRYFVNKFPECTGGPVSIPRDKIKNLCLDILENISSNQKTSSRYCDGGLYVGVGGIAYAFHYISRQKEFATDKSLSGFDMKYLEPALSYVERSKRDIKQKVSFILDAGGIYAIAAAIYHAYGNDENYHSYLQRYTALADVCVEIDFLPPGSDELLVGRAGYLSGILFLQNVFKKEVIPEEKVFSICEAMIVSGTNYSKRTKSLCPLMYQYHGTEYLGAAHGLSGILQILLCFPRYLDSHHEAKQKVKQAIDFILTLQTQSGNFPSAMDEVCRPRSSHNQLVHWCHGAPGVVYLMAKAYLYFKDEKYLQSCLACGEVTWTKGLLKKGPGICHGVAGSGYVFLLLYRLTQDPRHLQRAIHFADFLTSDEFKNARQPDSPFSLYEGLAGTAVFLADLLCPEEAHFPFFDVF